jgi:hypothetical protein
MRIGAAVRSVSCDGVLDFMDRASVLVEELILSFIGLHGKNILLRAALKGETLPAAREITPCNFRMGKSEW